MRLRWKHKRYDGSCFLGAVSGLALVFVNLFTLYPSHAQTKLQNPSHAQTKLQMFLPISPGAWTFYLADKKGYFRSEGLDVTMRIFSSGGEAGRAFQALGADMLEAGDVTSLIFLDRLEGNAVGVAQVARVENGIQLIGPIGIKSANDLKGKKIATNFGSSTEYFLRTYLRENGLEKDVQIINLDPGSQVPALIRGDVTAIVSFLEVGVAALSDPKYHLVKGWASSLILNVSKKFLDADATGVEKVLRALDRAAADVRSNPQAALKAVSGAHGLVDKAYLDYIKHGLDLTPQYSAETHRVLQGMSSMQLEQGTIKRAFDFCRHFNFEPLNKAKAGAAVGAPSCK